MSASEHEVIRDLLADLLNEQRATTAAIASLAVAIAHAGQGDTAVREQAKVVIEKAAAPTPIAKVVPTPKPAPAVADVATAAPQVPTAPAAPIVESPSEPAATGVTYKEVADIVVAYSKAHGRPATVEVLKGFGITALPSAKPEQYAAIKDAFEAVLV